MNWETKNLCFIQKIKVFNHGRKVQRGCTAVHSIVKKNFFIVLKTEFRLIIYFKPNHFSLNLPRNNSGKTVTIVCE